MAECLGNRVQATDLIGGWVNVSHKQAIRNVRYTITDIFCTTLFHVTPITFQLLLSPFYTLQKVTKSSEEKSNTNRLTAEAYSEPYRTSKMERFAKIVDGF